MDVELVRHRPTRITAALANKITSAIPNRLAYFDSQNFDMYPIVIRPVLMALISEPARNRIIFSWATNSVGFTLQSKSQLNLTTAAAWVDSTNVPAVVNSRFTVTNIITGAAQFYRLRKP
jgi:hypothetical protein